MIGLIIALYATTAIGFSGISNADLTYLERISAWIICGSSVALLVIVLEKVSGKS